MYIINIILIPHHNFFRLIYTNSKRNKKTENNFLVVSNFRNTSQNTLKLTMRTFSVIWIKLVSTIMKKKKKTSLVLMSFSTSLCVPVCQTCFLGGLFCGWALLMIVVYKRTWWLHNAVAFGKTFEFHCHLTGRGNADLPHLP